MKILFLVPYPLGESPSQRFRFEQYFSVLERQGWTYSVQTFLDSQNWQLFFMMGKMVDKAAALIKGTLKRFLVLFSITRYDFVFIHRETCPFGPPIFEWIIANVLRRKIIYDFDDAIWLTDRSQESWIMRLIKWRSKVKYIIRWSYRVSCGNDYLRSYALVYNPNSFFNPTTIDTEHLHRPSANSVQRNDDAVVIGWTGSHSTLKYLSQLEQVLTTLTTEFPQLKIVIIADRSPALKVPSMIFVPWKKDTEIEDLNRFDIGIMPLPDDEWSKGKCGFKILQYMAVGVPSVASAVGVNLKIIDNGITGYLCASDTAWYHALKNLIEDKTKRIHMGKLGRTFVEEHYSVNSNSSTFLAFFA